MKIEQVEEIKEEFKNELLILCDKRIEQIMDKYRCEKEQYNKAIRKTVKALAEDRQGSIVINWLRSSYVTESHNFKFTFYSGELYVEEDPDSILISLKPLFQGIEQDIESIDKIVKTKYYKFYSSGKEEIRRYYTEQVYRKCAGLFRRILEGNSKRVALEAYYGEYMGETLLL